jgi:hypothetical protein
MVRYLKAVRLLNTVVQITLDHGSRFQQPNTLNQISFVDHYEHNIALS